MGYKFGAAERIGDIGVLCMFAETETRIPDGFSRTAQTLEKDLGVLEKLRKLSQAVSDLKRETTFAKDLVQNVSHDLRSPLHTLRLVLSSLGEGEIVEAGVRSCDVAQSVVESLLDLTRDEMNPEEVRSELVSLAEIVREVIPMFRPITALKGVKLESGDFSEFYVVADKRHLKRIITNIISNSVKYTDKGFIRVSVVETEGFGQVIVEDSGCGMSKDELALLGEKGARFARDKAEGLGVGVYGTKQLVAKNGGTLEYSSDKGIGTTATLSFNIAEITKVQSA
jgi:two-component system sensor histidine kinase/response regulator